MKNYTENTLGKDLKYIINSPTPWFRTWIMGFIAGLFTGLTIGR